MVLGSTKLIPEPVFQKFDNEPIDIKCEFRLFLGEFRDSFSEKFYGIEFFKKWRNIKSPFKEFRNPLVIAIDIENIIFRF